MWAGLLLHFEALRGDGSVAPSPVGHVLVDVSPMPLGTNAAHDPTTLPKGLWARWKSLEATLNDLKMKGMTL